ncbi:MAG: BMC domain-containing protein [Proteobacteria bacterium]|nr:BMC domain-containing protein [Pseudomonadota bacterium]MCP4917869.1 BMC domain-containing protein [Pseudomonadota bacterium]
MPDALALLELDSIARGYRVVDAMVKKSPVEVLEANLVEPGRYLILFTGGVAEVDEARTEGLEVAGNHLVHDLFLPFVHSSILPGLRGELRCIDPDTVGVVETCSTSSALLACDRALKDADVELAGLRITPALGGKAFFVVQGTQADVEAALDVARTHAADRLTQAECIPRPHGDFLAVILRPAPFSLVT